jgi:hypothetical protein
MLIVCIAVLRCFVNSSMCSSCSGKRVLVSLSIFSKRVGGGSLKSAGVTRCLKSKFGASLRVFVELKLFFVSPANLMAKGRVRDNYEDLQLLLYSVLGYLGGWLSWMRKVFYNLTFWY